MATIERKNTPAVKIEVDSIQQLLAGEDDATRVLFAKALNLFVSPGLESISERERIKPLL